MKKLSFILVCMLSFLSVSIQAQDSRDYFVGKWDVMVYGTPKGDQRMIIKLNRVNGKLSGAIIGPTDDIKKFKKIEETANSVKVYFKHFLFTVDLLLEKKDSTNVTGKLYGKYKAIGKKMQ